MKKGFTLIELLAVILILSIVALIAIPIVNDVLKESQMGAFKTTTLTIANKAEEVCQLEGIKNTKITNLYTIINGKIDKPLEIKGNFPQEGYILVNNKCEVAYSFYDGDNTISKNFKETKQLVNNNNKNAKVYGLEWRSNISTLDDTYTRTLDASSIGDDEVNVQIGNTPVTNAFDKLDIYKDIQPYTDEFGNDFILIPKFYIKKTKEITNSEIIWNYAVSKHKLDNNYYLPASFVDEGANNKNKIELPYILVGKYEGSSNGKSGEEEKMVSKSGLDPKLNITFNFARTLANRYNLIDGINGYQQYDIHAHDLLYVLFYIEFASVNSQKIMRGNTTNSIFLKTGNSDIIKSSSGSLSNNGNTSFHYRGIENIWGNVWQFVDGINIDNNINNEVEDSNVISNIYVSKNSRLYNSITLNESYNLVKDYKKLNQIGYISDSGFDDEFPFVNLPIKIGGNADTGIGAHYYQDIIKSYKVALAGGDWDYGYAAGNSIYLNWTSTYSGYDVGARLLKSAIQ